MQLIVSLLLLAFADPISHPITWTVFCPDGTQASLRVTMDGCSPVPPEPPISPALTAVHWGWRAISRNPFVLWQVREFFNAVSEQQTQRNAQAEPEEGR